MKAGWDPPVASGLGQGLSEATDRPHCPELSGSWAVSRWLSPSPQPLRGLGAEISDLYLS